MFVTLCVAMPACAPEAEAPPGGVADAAPVADPDAAAVADPDAAAVADPDAAAVADPDAAADAAPVAEPDAAPACVEVTSVPFVLGQAGAGGEYTLTLPAASESATRWGEAGHEALVLEVRSAGRGFLGHLVLHQGRASFAYTMHLGHLAAGEAVSVQVSPLSAAAAAPRACVGPAALVALAANDPAAEGVLHAPIFRWPVGKRFDDLPVLVGWSRSAHAYQAVYTNENGGTVASCGGGARGMEAEVARWGRGCDIENVLGEGGASPTWGRCTGGTSYAQVTPRREADHAIFYYGDGHNRLYESRGGYGQACGTGGPERADGNLAGWNSGNPGNALALDAPFVITLRPLPVDLDALGYASHTGRREGLLDAYAPWIYRLTFDELAREGKIDGTHMRPIDQYLFVDVHAADVDGSGDRVCTSTVSKGFVVRMTSTGGPVQSGPQMTASYFGGADDWKRLAIPLDRAYAPEEITGLVFDAYDNDGIYLLGLGAAFVVRAQGDNGASLEYFHHGELPLAAYVDDDRSSCGADGANHDGPDALAYVCTGSDFSFAP